MSEMVITFKPARYNSVSQIEPFFQHRKTNQRTCGQHTDHAGCATNYAYEGQIYFSRK